MSNATKIYIFSFFQMALVIIPVVVPYYFSLGLTMADIFKLQALFGVAVMCCEIPTGYIADLWGRKKTLIAGSFFIGVGFTYLVFARSFAELVFTELVLAVGFSLISGADVSILYEDVAFSDKASRKKVLSNKQFAELLGEASAALLGGFLVMKSFHAVLVANAIAFWMPFLIALTFHEPAYQKLGTYSHRENFRQIFAHLFLTDDTILKLGFLNNVIWGLSTIVAVWALQRYWQLNHVDLVYFGVLWAVLNITAGVVGKVAHALEHRLGPLPLLAIIGLAPVIGYFGMASWNGAIGIACGLLFYICRGLNYVMLKDIVNWRTPSRFRTTINSAQSFFFRLGFALLGPVVGMGIDKLGMNPTLGIMSGVFLFLFVGVMLPLIKVIRRTSIDYIPEAKETASF
jgi:MFS family permease